MLLNALALGMLTALGMLCGVHALPIAVLHGIASSAAKMEPFVQWLGQNFNQPVYNLEIGNGEKTSLYTVLPVQLEILCKSIYAMDDLRNGFDFIGMSQGGLLARGYVEQCNLFPVRNLITLATPHGGVYFPVENFNPYGAFIQAHFSFTNYWRDPTALSVYYKKCVYLPNLNNENITGYSARNKANIETLLNFVLVWSPQDEIVAPPESGKFSVLTADLQVLPVQETAIYEALGLKTLYQTGRFHICQTNCSHEDHRNPICFNQLYPILSPFLI
jgi:palmitoyl-protein thioesterase